MRAVGPILCGLLALAAPVRAEPVLALRTGLRCSSCHVNATGGGGRTAYGAGYGRNTLPWSKFANWPGAFEGAVGDRIRVGADLRGSYEISFREHARNLEEFALTGAQVYAAVEILPERLHAYLDERVAPGGALNREAFLLIRPGRAGMWVKAGRFFPSHGWRLEDDAAATRTSVGFDFDTPDTGVEIGAEPGAWSLAASITNGNGGAAETNNGKQVALSASIVERSWRVGVSASDNDLPADLRRRTGALWGGFRAGPLTALAEWDALRSEPAGGGATRDGAAAHAELHALVHSGLTVRVWAGRYDPDRDVAGDRERQAGMGVDWTFLPGAQLRVFYRGRSGDGQGVVELHAYF